MRKQISENGISLILSLPLNFYDSGRTPPIPLHSIYSRSCWPNPWQDLPSLFSSIPFYCCNNCWSFLADRCEEAEADFEKNRSLSFPSLQFNFHVSGGTSLIPLHSIYSKSCWPNPWQDWYSLFQNTSLVHYSTITTTFRAFTSLLGADFMKVGDPDLFSYCQFPSIQSMAEAWPIPWKEKAGMGRGRGIN